MIESPQQLEEALRNGNLSVSGVAVTPATAMRSAAVFRCVTLSAGIVATVPMQVKRRIDDKVRADATDVPIWRVLNRRPNRWQKPAAFKRMMQAHVLLRGNAYAMKVRNAAGEVIELIPLHPDRVQTRQLSDLSVVHVWQRASGGQLLLRDDEVMHLYKLTLDGVTGVTPLTFAREAVDEALALSRHGAAVFKRGANLSGALKHPTKLTDEAFARLKEGMADFRAGGDREGETIILEEGMEYTALGMNMVDAEWINARNFSRTDIAMFFGTPPHLIGHIDGNTQLGSSIEQQTQGYLSFGLEDDLTMWEEGINVDCLDRPGDEKLYMRMNRNALVRGDFAARTGGYVRALQWGWMSPDEVRELEDMNPRPDGDGGKFYEPPNTAGDAGAPNDPTGGKNNA
ncbi:MAG: phage portal protein [Sphingomonas sp.]|nr:phage portal protein [Sphingomonas sp.]